MIQRAERPTNDSRTAILTLLCAAHRRVGELAAALGISESAVRVHLREMEREGLVRYETVRGSVGKPAHEYRLAPAGEALLSRAYLPFLQQVLGAVRARLDDAETERLFRAAGRGLAPPERPDGALRSRVDQAVGLMGELGGVGMVEERAGELVIRGRCCPLAAIVPEHPQACAAMEAMLAEFIGAPVRAECDVDGRPSCRFVVRDGPGGG